MFWDYLRTTLSRGFTHPNPTGSPVIRDGQQLHDNNGAPQFYYPGPSEGDRGFSDKIGLPGIVASDGGFYYFGPQLKAQN